MKKIIKKIFVFFAIMIIVAERCFTAASDNDGSAFITKAEFDSLKNNFQSQIDSYNQSIDSKIDTAIAAYFAGIKVTKETTVNTIFSGMGLSLNNGKKIVFISGKNNQKWFDATWPTVRWHGEWGVVPGLYYNYKMTSCFGINASQTDFWAQDLGYHEIYLSVCDKNASNANVVLIGTGNSVDHLEYGYRGYLQKSVYMERKNAGTSYRAPILGYNNTDKRFVVTFAADKPKSMSSQGGFTVCSTTANHSGYVYYLRGASGTSTTRIPVTLPYEVPSYTDKTVLKKDYNYVTPGDSYSNFTNTTNLSFDSFAMAGTSSITYGDEVIYLFPNSDDTNTLFLMDKSVVTNNWETVTLPADGVDADNLADYFTVEQSRHVLSYSEMSYIFANAAGLTEYMPDITTKTVPPFNILFKGSYTKFTSSRLKKMTDVNYKRLSNSMGADVSLGDSLFLIHNAEKSGILEITGGIRFSFSNTGQWAPSGNCIVAFSKHGRSDEVNNGDETSQNWNVINKIPFKYRVVGSTTWIDATNDCILCVPSGSNPWYEFKFDVNKGDDIYLHYMDIDDYLNQVAAVIAEPAVTATITSDD